MTAGSSQFAIARPRRELTALTRLRWLAAVHVLVFHTLGVIGGPSTSRLPVPVLRFISHGQSSVSFFFVLSGFLLAHNYSGPDGFLGRHKAFYWSRFARIYPVYLCSFALDMPRVIILFERIAASPFQAALKACTVGLAYLSLMQSWHPRLTNAWNAPGWSLSVEAFFYLVCPWLLTIGPTWRTSRAMLVALAAWASVILSYLCAVKVGAVDFADPEIATFWRSAPILRLPEFVLGIATARVFQRTSVTVTRWTGVITAFGAGVIVLVLLTSTYPSRTLLDNQLLAPVFCILVLGVGWGSNRSDGPPRRDLARLLGEASYALYILHEPVEWWFMRAAARFGLATPSPVLFAAYFAFVTGLCVATFLYLEAPARVALLKSARVRNTGHCDREQRRPTL